MEPLSCEMKERLSANLPHTYVCAQICVCVCVFEKWNLQLIFFLLIFLLYNFGCHFNFRSSATSLHFGAVRWQLLDYSSKLLTALLFVSFSSFPSFFPHTCLLLFCFVSFTRFFIFYCCGKFFMVFPTHSIHSSTNFGCCKAMRRWMSCKINWNLITDDFERNFVLWHSVKL